MRYEVTSLNTKRLLADSLRKSMKKKSFSKITVTEICADCGVNRKTFYYHFEDIYALLKWILEQEAFEILHNFDLLEDFDQIVLFILNYIDTNKPFLNSIYDSLGYDGLREFLHEDFIQLISATISRLEKQEGYFLSSDYRMFLSHFYARALSGTMTDLLKDVSRKSPKETQEIICFTLKTSLLSIIHTKGTKAS